MSGGSGAGNRPAASPGKDRASCCRPRRRSPAPRSRPRGACRGPGRLRTRAACWRWGSAPRSCPAPAERPSPPRRCGPRAPGRSWRSERRCRRGRRCCPGPCGAGRDRPRRGFPTRGCEGGGPLPPRTPTARRRSASVQLTAKRGCTATRSLPFSLPWKADPQALGLGESLLRGGAQVRRRRLRVVHEDVAARVADAGARRGSEERVGMADGAHVENRRHPRGEALGEAKSRGDRHRLLVVGGFARPDVGLRATARAPDPRARCAGASGRGGGAPARSPGSTHLPRASSLSTGSPGSPASRRASSPVARIVPASA